MLEQLSKNPEIQSFLDDFPKHQWRKCIEGGLLLGIRKLRERPSKTNYSDILIILGETQEDSIRIALQNMRKEIEEISGKVETMEKRPKIDSNLKIPRINTSESEIIKPSKRESPSRGSLKSKQLNLPRQNSYGSISKPQERKIPKYLKNVKSKIKGEVMKDIEEFVKHESRSGSVAEFERSNSGRELREPNVMPLDRVKSLKNEENEVFKIADDFLSNPFTSYLSGGYKYINSGQN
jgi:hypothetical protein